MNIKMTVNTELERVWEERVPPALIRHLTGGTEQSLTKDRRSWSREFPPGVAQKSRFSSAENKNRTDFNESRDSSVGIATGYGLDDQGVGFRVQVGARILNSPCRPDRP
jgi:hypothetical protein